MLDLRNMLSHYIRAFCPFFKQVLQKPARIIFGDALYSDMRIAFFIDGNEFGYVDFYISELIPMLYISYSELMMDMDICKAKLEKFKEDHNTAGFVILERNVDSITLYNEIAEHSTLALHLDVLPIGCQAELAGILKEMALLESKPTVNPFKQKVRPDLGAIQMKMVQQITGVGDKKGLLLLQKFGSIEGIANATKEELSSLVGDAGANVVRNFFHKHIHITENS